MPLESLSEQSAVSADCSGNVTRRRTHQCADGEVRQILQKFASVDGDETRAEKNGRSSGWSTPKGRHVGAGRMEPSQIASISGILAAVFVVVVVVIAVARGRATPKK